MRQEIEIEGTVETAQKRNTKSGGTMYNLVIAVEETGSKGNPWTDRYPVSFFGTDIKDEPQEGATAKVKFFVKPREWTNPTNGQFRIYVDLRGTSYTALTNPEPAGLPAAEVAVPQQDDGEMPF